jgi:hypothetical protein
MITDLLLQAGAAVLTPLLSMFSWAAPAVQDVSGASILGSSLGTANNYLPVGLFLSLILAGFAFDLTLTGAQALVWVYNKIPFKAT